jgi:hypothetical protein
VLDVASGDAPVVMGVSVYGTDWNEALREGNALEQVGPDGYCLDVGSDGPTTLPWTNVDRIAVRFSEPVEVSPYHLSLAGANVSQYEISSFRYDFDTFAATWTLQEPIGVDTLSVELADSVRDLDGNPLDGDRSTAPSAYPSGDGVPGGDFHFRFSVVPGDVDGSGATDMNDFAAMRTRQFNRAGDPDYDVLHDLDGNGLINVADWISVRNRLGSELPSDTPAAAGSALVAAEMRTDGLDRRAAFISQIATEPVAAQPYASVDRATIRVTPAQRQFSYNAYRVAKAAATDQVLTNFEFGPRSTTFSSRSIRTHCGQRGGTADHDHMWHRMT